MTVVLFFAGLLLLVAGAELLVRGASQLAASLGIAPLVIGLTVVAFGTSAPELAVSVYSSLSGQSEIAIGNVVGSNIMNVLFILGIASMICPLAVSKQLIRVDVPIMIGVSILVVALAWNSEISKLEGGFLFAGLVTYTLMQLRFGKSKDSEIQEPVVTLSEPTVPSFWSSATANIGYVVVGLGILVAGSNLFVSCATSFARAWGVSEAVIGTTIVAAGTSLPELVTSVVAALKGQRDLAVGNVVGSNLFNLLGVLGISAMASPDGMAVIPAVFGFDFPVMVVTAIVCLPIFFTGGEISRWEGMLFFAYYIAYATLLLVASQQNELAVGFKTAMLYFVVPLTIVTIAVSVVNTVRKPSG